MNVDIGPLQRLCLQPLTNRLLPLSTNITAQSLYMTQALGDRAKEAVLGYLMWLSAVQLHLAASLVALRNHETCR